MSDLARVSISLDGELLKGFDRMVEAEGYPTRSEAVKALLRAALVSREWAGGTDVAGAVTLVYDHHQAGLVRRLVEVQHDHSALIVCAQHVHLDHDNCMEIVVVKGRTREIRRLLADLNAVKGLKHSSLITATTGHGHAHG